MNSSEVHKFIFLAGVHGVGKSALCRQIFEPAGFHCVSASSIIKSANGEVTTTKTVSNVDANQQKLLSGLDRLKLTQQRVILDGHFAILTANKTIQCIDIEVFRQMAPEAIIVIKGDPQLIGDRLESRDGKFWSAEFIAELQESEIAHAKRVADAIAVPLYTISSAEEAKRLTPMLAHPDSSGFPAIK